MKALMYMVCGWLFLISQHAEASNFPRILVSIDSQCSFNAVQLCEKIEAQIFKGTEDELKNLVNDGQNHVIILDSTITNLPTFAVSNFYDFICLSGTLKESIDTLTAKINSLPKSDIDLPKIDAKERGRFYKLMMVVDQILNENQISYWGISGTLLGAYRHKGMIPWDDDLDIIITYHNKHQFERLLPLFRSRGLELINFGNFFYKIFPINGENILGPNKEAFPWRYPFIDIFLVNKVNNKFRIVSVTDPMKDIYPGYNGKDGWSLSFSDLYFPIKRIKFGPMQLPIPNNALNVLKKEYGDDCLDVAYLQYSHRNEKRLSSIKVKIKNFSPPEYILPKTDFTGRIKPIEK